jgi:hypothetical protein
MSFLLCRSNIVALLNDREQGLSDIPTEISINFVTLSSNIYLNFVTLCDVQIGAKYIKIFIIIDFELRYLPSVKVPNVHFSKNTSFMYKDQIVIL